jgi:mannitol/fructose-specific phosphotransferase system IIA component (Ntr-type)
LLTLRESGEDLGIKNPKHCIPNLIGAWGRSSKGIQFDSLDHGPVYRVALFLIPQGEFQRHLALLAQLAKWLHQHG